MKTYEPIKFNLTEEEISTFHQCMEVLHNINCMMFNKEMDYAACLYERLGIKISRDDIVELRNNLAYLTGIEYLV